MSVRIDTVQVADADATLQYPGRVVSSQDANVAFKVAGTLSRVYVKEGQKVAAGQLLAEIDPVDYKVQLSATEAEYAQIKADAERIIALYKDGGVTASVYDKARYGLEQITAKLQNHRNQVEYCKLYAPFSGTVKTVFFDSRETVGTGMPVIGLMGNDAVEFEVNLPAASYLNRAKFSGFTATLDILPGEVIDLDLINIMPRANSNQLYTMRLKQRNPHKNIAAGMSAWVTIETSDSLNAAVRLPSTALVEENGKVFIFLYKNSTHLVSKAEVKVDRLNTDGTAIVVGDVKPGNLVVTSGAHYVKDGDRVNPLQRISQTNVGGLL